jgi:hypothetical protein
MLRDLGILPEKVIENLSRWEGVNILRDESSKAISMGIQGDFKKFARGQ